MTDASTETRLRTLHEELSLDLLNYFLRRVAVREDAADLLAMTFITAWQKIDRLPSEDESARMWMFVTARNVHRNFERTTRRYERLSERLRRDLSETDQPANDGERLDVHAAIRMLPANQRELVMLIHWEGFSVPEACRVLGIRESTARGRYQRARAALRLSLAETEAHRDVQLKRN